MSWKSLALLVVLVAGLGGFLLYDTYRLAPARDKADAAKGRLWSVEPKDVEAVTIKRPEDTLRLKRVEGGWEMLEPVKARGDRGPIEEVVTSLATVRMDREIDPKPAKPADFGLEPPAAEIRLDVKGRSEPLVLAVGVKSPTGAWVYGREGAKPAVITMSEVVARDVSRPAADFRDKSVIAFDRKHVNAVDLEVEGDRISLARDDGGAWQITRPTAYRADGDLIGDFLEKLESAKAKEFVDQPRSPAQYGLDRPAKVTVWIGKDKDRSARTLLVGRPDKDKKGVHVMRDGQPPVMLVGEELWTALPKTVAALRDKVVVAYAYDKANRIELEHGRGKVMLERDGTGWKITAPEALKADSAAINSLLWRIRDLRAQGFLAESASDVPRYLAKPDVTVRIWEEGAREPKALLLRASTETRGGQPAAIAAVQGQGPVMLVEAQALTDLSRTVTDLRDKSILPAFEVNDVKRARITAGGKPLVIERSGDTDWKVLEPSRGSANGAKASNLLLTLKALRWKEIASAGGEDAARFGLDKPELEVSLLKADGGELGALLIGKQDGAVTYVRAKSAPAIYAVESKQVEDLRKAPTEIPSQS